MGGSVRVHLRWKGLFTRLHRANVSLCARDRSDEAGARSDAGSDLWLYLLSGQAQSRAHAQVVQSDSRAHLLRVTAVLPALCLHCQDHFRSAARDTTGLPDVPRLVLYDVYGVG